MNSIRIRGLKDEEFPILKDILYEAIFQPNGRELSKSIIEEPGINVYIKGWGQKDDLCLIAEIQSTIIGAVWTRILSYEPKGYGNIDDQTPEFAIALFEKYRNFGYGTFLMKEMIAKLKIKGYKQASLSVDKSNYAVKMYKKLGFKIVKENKHDYLMLLKLEGQL